MNKKTLIFGMAVLLQVVLLSIIPIPHWLALVSGRTVVLETAPVDPYAIFQGYYAQLSYRISRADNLPFTGSGVKPVDGNYYYVILSPTVNGVWEPQKVLERAPGKLPSKEAALKGRYNGWGMEYGIEQYYLPENKREELLQLLQDRNQKILVMVKVGAGGQGAIEKIQVGGKEFEY